MPSFGPRDRGRDSLAAMEPGGRSFPLGCGAPRRRDREPPGTPRPPFPYDEERVRSRTRRRPGSARATVTIPARSRTHPAWCLISVGQQDRRDPFGHKPFAVARRPPTRRGFVVLPPTTAASAESVAPASATSEDFATDVEALVATAAAKTSPPPARAHRHSEGGLIAPMVAVKDPALAFIVLLAAPGPARRLRCSSGRAARCGAPAAPVPRPTRWQTAMQPQLFAAWPPSPTAPSLARRLKPSSRRWYPRIPAAERGNVDQKRFVEEPKRTLTTPWMRSSSPTTRAHAVEGALRGAGGGRDQDLQSMRRRTWSRSRPRCAGAPTAT